ncbi:MAG: hypothetical protein NTY96_04185 [Bacteroidetes bacterium]|nr:hypothetical protein [Bacteroidota bacterium]
MNDFLTQSHWIGKFTDNELSSEQETQLLYQASQNPLLRNELRLDKDLTEMFADPELIELSETIRKTIKDEKSKVHMPFYLKIAASVIILISLAGFTGFIINYTNQRYGNDLLSHQRFLKPQLKGLWGLLPGNMNPNMSSTPVKRRAIVQNSITDNPYTPRPEYEFLVGTVTRDISVMVISPMPRVKCRSDSLLQFSWRWLTGPVPLCLEITDNHGRIVLNYLQMTDVSYILNTKQWARGLYYYKITSGDELVTMGSISIY